MVAGSDVSKGSQMHRRGVIYLMVNKKPWKQNTKFNITIISQKLQYHNHNTI